MCSPSMEHSITSSVNRMGEDFDSVKGAAETMLELIDPLKRGRGIRNWDIGANVR